MPIDNRTCFLVNLRDALRCRNCGRPPTQRETYHRGFGYHHVRAIRDGGPDIIENLVLLCRPCHDDHHHGRRPLAFGPQASPGRVRCMTCAAMIDPLTTPMNCGWYACSHCTTRVHLFDHFGYAEPG